MNTLRIRLIAVFLAATLVPLAATWWITRSLLEHSLSLSATNELDRLSRTLEQSGRAVYLNASEALRAQVAAKQITPRIYKAAERANWPDDAKAFAGSGEAERFHLTGPDGGTLEYLVRNGDDVLIYSKQVGGPGMRNLSAEYTRARAIVDRANSRDLRKGYTYTFALVAASVWLIAFIAVVYWASKISRPVHDLTAGLSELAAGNLAARVRARGKDEVGEAMRAFNRTAEKLQQSQDRLVHVTRIASWQVLARKMAHEVKNSLTPIRLTVEEIVARKNGERDERFIEQAAQIVVDEVGTLERRVRAFSEFAAEPPVSLAVVDVNMLLSERVTFLKAAHPGLTYRTSLAPVSEALADEDLLKGVLTNLLENAADAAGPGGVILAKSFENSGKVGIEIHDSGPGLTSYAQSTLFEPTITFKKAGMGLGLSIARKSVLMLGGDILLIDGELGGAGFRILLQEAHHA